jgi:hypothetical protein
MFTRPGWRGQLTENILTLEDPDVPFTIDLNLLSLCHMICHPIQDPIQLPKGGKKAGSHKRKHDEGGAGGGGGGGAAPTAAAYAAAALAGGSVTIPLKQAVVELCAAVSAPAAAMGALRRDFVELADDVDAFGHDPVA